MAEIRYNDLLSQLNPMERQNFEGVFGNPGWLENYQNDPNALSVTGHESYNKFLPIATAASQSKTLDQGFFDNLFSMGSADAAMATPEEIAAIERRSADIERRSGVPPGGRELPLQFRNPQEYYMQNRPYEIASGRAYDSDYKGPIGATGRRPDKGGFIEYQEPFEHPYGIVGRRYSPEYLQQDAANKGWFTRDFEFDEGLQQGLINRNRENLYGDEGIGAIDVEETLTEQAPLDTSRFQDMYWGPSSEEDEEVVSEGITKGDKWRNFLSKITRQPYRPAMGGVTMGSGRTYSPAQLNKMNALGGWYSEPARIQRRTQNRVNNMLARREAGKSFSQKNLEAFTGRDEGRGSYTATPTRSAAAASARGVDVGATGMMGPGGRHYMRGGRVGYNTGGRVGILSIF